MTSWKRDISGSASRSAAVARRRPWAGRLINAILSVSGACGQLRREARGERVDRRWLTQVERLELDAREARGGARRDHVWCARCEFDGAIVDEVTIALAIPAGVADGTTFTVPLDADGEARTLRVCVRHAGGPAKW
jgi:hypothetical protein